MTFEVALLSLYLAFVQTLTFVHPRNFSGRGHGNPFPRILITRNRSTTLGHTPNENVALVQGGFTRGIAICDNLKVTV
ncbi:hypothetical protein EDB85DRAFT_118970 [Lactarius pseudohatsudake]|nr:hypothetical protein EDB85DRAFT_118970 [Lactarius pseudohatsudake]